MTDATTKAGFPPRAMALTEDLVARVARDVPDTGPPSYDGMTLLTDNDRLALARRLLKENEGAPFWIFGYGSLIWKPAHDHIEARRVVAHGWRRMYSLEVDYWRGTKDAPGLMLALEQGGCCTGVAYLLPPDDAEGRMLRFLAREVAYHEDTPSVRWITVRAGGQSFRALCSWVARRGDPYFLRLPVDEQARRLARAVGHLGSCAEYLRNTVLHLEEMGIRDRYLWRMQQLVAEEIRALHPRPGD
jgi:cation transport protein ChaC